MEVAYITLHETSLELIGIVDDDPNKQGKKMFGFAIGNPKDLKYLNPDAIVITSIRFKDEILYNLNNDKALKQKQIRLCSL